MKLYYIQFYHVVSCKHAKWYWINMMMVMQKMLKMQTLIKPKAFFLGIMDKLIEKQFWSLFFFIWWQLQGWVYQIFERKRNINSEKMILKPMELAEMAKFIVLIRNNGLRTFIRKWKSFVDLLWVKYNNGLFTEALKFNMFWVFNLIDLCEIQISAFN